MRKFVTFDIPIFSKKKRTNTYDLTETNYMYYSQNLKSIKKINKIIQLHLPNGFRICVSNLHLNKK